MNLKTRLARLHKALAPLPCYGPPIPFIDLYEDEEPPAPPPCPCGSKHRDRVHQIVVVRHREDEAPTDSDGRECATRDGGGSKPCA